MENHSKAVSNNGVFHPVILLDGKVIGTWKQTNKKDYLVLTAELFNPSDDSVIDSLRRATIPLGHFTKKNIRLE